MAKYTLQLPNNIRSFSHNGEEFRSNDTYETDSACDAIGFYSSATEVNPELGARDDPNTPDAWQRVIVECARESAHAISIPPPPPAQASPPVEDDTSPGPDTPSAQGAPAAPESVSAADSTAPSPGGSGDESTAEEPTRPPDRQPHPTRAAEQPQEQTAGGDPVDLFTGSVQLLDPDLVVPNTVLPLFLARMYRSGPGFYGPFGWNWDHNHNLFLRELDNGDIALWRSANEERFVLTGTGFEPPRGVFERLERVFGVPQAFEVTGPGGSMLRFERPRGWVDGTRVPLLYVSDRHGNRLSYSYDTSDRLLMVGDQDGHYIEFEYDRCGLISAAADSSGRRWVYDHDEETRHLIRVTKPPTSDFPDGTQRCYHYEPAFTPPSTRHNLLRIEDSDGNVYLQNVYEKDPSSWQFGRVIEQLYGDFLFQFRYTQLQWVPADARNVNIHSVRTEVLNPNLGLEIYTFNFRGDLLDRRYRLHADRSYRVVAELYEYDGQGNRSKITKPDGSEERSTYDFANPDPRMRGRLLRRELTAASGFPSPGRVVWQGRYEPIYQLPIEETDESGATTRIKYDFDLTPGAATNTGKLMEVRQPDVTLPDRSNQQAITAFEYNTRGQLVAAVLPDRTRNEFRYGTAAPDNGCLVEERYDAAGLAVVRRRRYDIFGFEFQTTDGNGGVSQRIHNALGQIEKLVHPAVAGSTSEERCHYDSDGKIVGVERPIGAYSQPLLDPATTHFVDLIERDVLGFATRAVLRSNTEEARTFGFCTDYRGMPLQTTTPDGATIKTTFDERRLPLDEEVIGHDGLRIRSRNTYDRAGSLIRQVDAFGSVTEFQYDGFSRVGTVALPNGSQRRFSWLARDLLESEEVIGDDGTGVVRQLSFTRHTYDTKGRRVSTTVKSFTDDPSASTDVTTTFHYDNMDRITKMVDNRGGESTREYDGLGRVVVERDPMGNEERYAYDHNGNMLRQVSHHKEPGGTVTSIAKTFEYDARDRRTAVIEPDGARFESVYDDRDLAVETIDMSGVVTRIAYDSFNARTQQVHNAGGLDITHQWSLDNMSRVIAYTDPSGEISKYGFDSVGRLTVLEYPNGLVSARTVNDSSQVVRETLGSGVELQYAFDAANRLTSVVNSVAPPPLRAIPTHEFTYDGLDRPVGAVADGDEITRKYDSQGRLLAETTLGSTISCRYNDASGEVEKQWPDGRTEVLSHDLNGVLSAITQSTHGNLGAGTGPLVTFLPSGPGLLGDAEYRGGTTVTTTYDERKRVTEIAAMSPAGLDQRVKYRYDRRSLRRVEAIAGRVPKTSYFEFDANRRLSLARAGFDASIASAITQAEHDAAIANVQAASSAANHTEELRYGAADSRTLHTSTGAVDKNYTYASGHRVRSDGTTVYEHHVDGALESNFEFNYEVDAFGRVTAVRSGTSLVLELTYDALGRPSRLQESGRPAQTFNYLGGFIEQENENGSPTRQMTLHPITGVPVAYHSAFGTHYALVDGRFNLLGLVNVDGVLVETYRYRPFGAPAIFDRTGSRITSSALGSHPIFGGQRYMTGPRLYLSTKRLMDPEHGMFLAPDPSGYVDSPNLYAYAAQDPVNNIDPNGGYAVPAIVAVLIIGGAAIGMGYAWYDQYNNPELYEGWGILRTPAYVFGGAGFGALAAAPWIVAAAGGTAAAGTSAAGAASVPAAATGGGAAGFWASIASWSEPLLLSGFSSAGGGSLVRMASGERVTAGTLATDVAFGGAFAGAVRLLPTILRPTGVPNLSWGDLGMSTMLLKEPLGPYRGRIGALLDLVGIRQGYPSLTTYRFHWTTPEHLKSQFRFHEYFHELIARYVPTLRKLSLTKRFWGAAVRYPEEVGAYTYGAVRSGHYRDVLSAPTRAFGSLSGFSRGQQFFAERFWRAAGFGGGGFGVGAGVGSAGIDIEDIAETIEGSAQAQPNEKPPGSK